MGMSASQARLISLLARQSNLEYQGQQINQARTVLSQQCTALYNSLLSMTVPTPPATTDFTKVQYSGTLGTTEYSFEASDVRPGKDGGYNVTLGFTDYGNTLNRNNGYATVTRGTEKVEKGQFITAADVNGGETSQKVDGYYIDKNASDDAPAAGEKFFKVTNTKPSGQYWIMNEEGTALVPGGHGYNDQEGTNHTYYTLETDPAKWDPMTCIKPTTSEMQEITVTTDTPATVKLTKADMKNLYVVDDSTGMIRKAEPNQDYTVEGDTVYLLPDVNYFWDNGQGSDTAERGTENGYKISGYSTMSMKEWGATLGEKEDYAGYLEAIQNSGLKKADGTAYTEDDFVVYVDDSGQPHFALIQDVQDNDSCVTYDYLANGKFTKDKTYENAKLTFDAATGRISSIDIPSGDIDPATGKPSSWSTIELKAETVTDELAYQDAYNDYEYEQYLYDQKQKEINAKTEIIQEQDRNLELKLQRLDNERTMITTEIEAVQKVIGDNIEGSFKSFSG